MVLDLARTADRQRAVLDQVELAVVLPQIQSWLMALQQEAIAQADLAYWVAGKVPPQEGIALVPPLSDLDGVDAMRRIQRKVQSLGPRIMKVRREGAIGAVEWQGDVGASYAEAFPPGKIAEVARELFDQGLQTGIIAAMAYRDEATQQVVVSRIGGLLRVLYNLEDMSRTLGLYQCWQHWDYRRKTSWSVRIYDFRTKRLSEWTDLAQPYMIGQSPTRIVEAGPMPRFAILQQGPDGQPLGELMQAWPILRKELAQQMQLARMEEATAFPFLVFSGIADTSQRERGPTRVFHFPQGGTATYVQPGSLNELREEHELTLTRLQHDLVLPGGFAGRGVPSGEALREANVKFYNASREYADAITGVANDVLVDFAALSGAPQAELSVAPNRETFSLDILDRVINLYEKGIIPLQVAAREVQPILSTFSDKELTEWIAQQTGRPYAVTPELVRLLLGGTYTPRSPAT